MSTNNTNTAKAIADLTAGYTIDMNAVLSTLMQQSELIKQLQFQMATQAAAVAQTQPQPSAPTLAPEAPKPEKPPFDLSKHRPEDPFIPQKLEFFCPCSKDKNGKLTDIPNGQVSGALGTYSKYSMVPDAWETVLEVFESGIAREMFNTCKKTGEKQVWHFNMSPTISNVDRAKMLEAMLDRIYSTMDTEAVIERIESRLEAAYGKRD